MPDSLYERAFDTLPVGAAVLDAETTRIAAANPAFADAFGRDTAAVEGDRLADLTTLASADLTETIDRAAGGASTRVECVLSDSAGDGRRAALDLSPLADTTGSRLLCTLEAAESDQRSGHGETSNSERRLNVALNGTDTGVWEWDLASDDVVWTESMEQLFGLEPGTFEGTIEAFAERIHPEDLPDVEAAIESALAAGDPFQTEFRTGRDAGDRRWVQARGEFQPDLGEDGRLLGIVTDITERKQNERALRREERRYRQLVERLPVGHYTIDGDWRLTFCNEKVADRLGTTVEAIEGELLWDIFPEAEDTVVEDRFRTVMETGTPQTFEYDYDSGEHWVRVRAYPYGDGVAAVSSDISDQRETVQRVLDATPVVVYRFDSDGVFEEVRGDMLSRLGLDSEDLVGESIFEAYADNENVLQAAERALDGEQLRYTLSLGDLTLETQYKPVYTDGEVTSVIGVSMDVTELHRQREQMEFFNSILRHDVLNGMTVIKMRAELLADQLDGEHAQYAQTIVDWSETTTEVTKRVRRVVETLATPEEEHELEPVNVSAILERKCDELANAYADVAFETDVPTGTFVRADELLSDVLGNVLTNSIEHNDDEGLRVATSVTVDSDTVTVRVTDNGVGIADDRKASVFRRGETSHAKETGSGFGLFFVDVMIEKYGGAVRVEDSEAGGARFVIELPRVHID